MTDVLKGVKTVAVGAAMIVLPPLLEYVGGIDWRTVVPDNFSWAVPMISGAVMIALRWVTKTPIFQKSASVDPTDPRLGGLQ